MKLLLFSCILTTVDPDTGVKSKDMQPLKTLQQFVYLFETHLKKKKPNLTILLDFRYRMNTEIDKTGPLFGAYLDWIEGNKLIKIGDLIMSRD